jgi:hypothetical protein
MAATGPDGGAAGSLGVAALLPALVQARRVTEYGGFEVAVRGFGSGGPGLAGRLAGQVLAWDGLGRPGSSRLRLRAYPLDTPVDERPGQVVLDRQHTRLALSWAAV